MKKRLEAAEWLTWAVVIGTAVVLVVLMASCAVMTPESRAALERVLAGALARGDITREQYDAALGGLSAMGSTFNWQSVLDVLLGGVLGYFGVQLRRGPPTQKVGLPASKVLP